MDQSKRALSRSKGKQPAREQAHWWVSLQDQGTSRKSRTTQQRFDKIRLQGSSWHWSKGRRLNSGNGRHQREPSLIRFHALKSKTLILHCKQFLKRSMPGICSTRLFQDRVELALKALELRPDDRNAMWSLALSMCCGIAQIKPLTGSNTSKTLTAKKAGPTLIV